MGGDEQRRTELTPEKLVEVRESLETSGMMKAIGAQMFEAKQGYCRLDLPFSKGVSQHMGFFHGGAIGALADTAGGCAALTVMPFGTQVLTLEYKINFLRPGIGDRLIAEATVLRAGRSVAVTRVDVYVEAAGRRTLCAASQMSLMQAPSRADAPSA